MPSKSTPKKHFNVEGSFEKKVLQITRKKELVYHYKSQIYKLNRKAKAYQYQIDKIQVQIKDYERERSLNSFIKELEKTKIEKSLANK